MRRTSTPGAAEARPRDHDHRNPTERRIGPHGFEKLLPVHPGHQEVDEHDAGTGPPRELAEGVVQARVFADIVSFLAQDFGNAHPDVRIVLRDENVRRTHAFSTSNYSALFASEAQRP